MELNQIELKTGYAHRGNCLKPKTASTVQWQRGRQRLNREKELRLEDDEACECTWCEENEVRNEVMIKGEAGEAGGGA